ncbi:uncharacterized protein LOC127265960 isoform X2 [Andrographis paniculata]|uniref:uncharacterized protein LOC127265960 isoform X2 n=1 Tax=Andrographis paniculata TaxID=175694 RepID=UPI0021E93108|nr:uncharacterized protein LOC127265960 isoform X2 [Andrographis paniculata]
MDNTLGCVMVELPLGDAASDFNLEKAVCSDGLFMMAPNHWDSPSKTLTRPLRLSPDGAASVVRISHRDRQALHLRVLGTRSLSPPQRRSLQVQVRRMLRLSEEESWRVKEFHELHQEAKGRGFGRLFRSPTLFEDMVKWPRTLSMAEALCELQLELQSAASAGNGTTPTLQATEYKHFAPNTPARKESKKRSRRANAVEMPESYKGMESSPITDNLHLQIQAAEGDQPLNTTGDNAGTRIANFPSPEELARLDEKFLAKRCGLGYRAGRVINLARGIIQGTIQLDVFEDACGTPSLSVYNSLFEKLRAIDGFGPFTCANVLVCMGFYHNIPTDSETIRHLKQVHGKISDTKTVGSHVEKLYGKYAPFQHLAYWYEVWHFYEEWFGNLSEIPRPNYRLITAANMKPEKLKSTTSKKMKL